MKKKILLMMVCILIISLIGCVARPDVYIKVENKDGLGNNVFGVRSLVEIGGGLWYDSTTRIVYWWNGVFWTGYESTVPTAYFAPNGLPYRYNPSTNTFEVIEG